MYAIIDENGKQYRVTSGQEILIDRPVTGEEKTITFGRVLLVAGEGQPKVGTPAVANASVTGEIVGPEKGPKVDIFKYRRRKGYHKHIGHRQKYVRVRITGINV